MVSHTIAAALLILNGSDGGIMDLEVRTISFLSSGALSVEVNGGAGGSTLSGAALDVVKLWVYIPEYEKKSSLEEVMNTALRIARESLK
jgi:hypothetical protein